MNPYENIGICFLSKLDYLVRRKDLKTKDSLFKVLHDIRLRKEHHLGLYVANQIGLGDESFFYTYWDKIPVNLLVDEETKHPFGSYNKGNDLFKDLMVSRTEMGAWQAFLLWMSPTVLPLFWHGGYIRRIYFFDRGHFECPPSMWDGQRPIDLMIEKIPQPTVTMEGEKAVVTCPYWNNWEGLVLESVPVYFKADGSATIRRAKHKVLYKYDCGICY